MASGSSVTLSEKTCAPWLLAAFLLVAALVAVVGLALIAFWQGPVSAAVALLVGYSLFLTLFDQPASRRPSSR